MHWSASRFWRELTARGRELQRLAVFWRPVAALPLWMEPAVAIGAILALVVLSGVAVLSVGVLLTALLLAHLLLEYVLGISLAPSR